MRREGPERAIYNYECGTAGAPCYEPRTAAGFPLQFWFDTPGVSVEHHLALGEDSIRVGPLVLDLAFYMALLGAALWGWGRRPGRGG